MTLVRGCGSRMEDGAYLECPVGNDPNARPLDHFLIDPPIPALPFGLNAEMLARKTMLYQFPIALWKQLSAMGLDPGAWHILDWIGREHYPYVSDYIEETREHGISRRIPTAFDFAKITRGSKLILIHPRAYLANWQHVSQPFLCLKDRDGHSTLSTVKAPIAGPCIYKCADLIPKDDGTPTGRYEDEAGREMYRRQIGSTTYHYTPTGEYADLQPGIFLAIRPARLAIITMRNEAGERRLGPKGQRLADRLNTSGGGLDFRICDE